MKLINTFFQYCIYYSIYQIKINFLIIITDIKLRNYKKITMNKYQQLKNITSFDHIPYIINQKEDRLDHPEHIQPISTQISYSNDKPYALYEQIQLHLKQQTQRIIKRTLFKQSIIKCSLDKDYAYLFQDSAFKFKTFEQQQQQDVQTMQVQMNQHQQKICQWLDKKQKQILAHLSFRSFLNFYKILAFKVDKLCIIVTNYHNYLTQKLPSLKTSRNIPVQWACLSTALPLNIKTKILELYQLKKLKLLFISPQLFQNQQYHSFQCQLLVITDIHLYKNKQDLFHKIIKKTGPQRILGIYQHFSQQNIKKLGIQSLPRNTFNFQSHIWLKTDSKLKTLSTFINKNDYKKILILVSDKKNSVEISNSLSLVGRHKITSIYEVLPKALLKNFSLPSLLTKKYKNQLLMLKHLQKLDKYHIIVSDYFDCLKLIKFDLVIHYTFDTIDSIIQKSYLANFNCVLLSQQDYFFKRNQLNSIIFSRQSLMNSLQHILTKSMVQNNRRLKRHYSQTIDQLLIQKFSITKQEYLYDDVKSIKLINFCESHQINKTQLQFLLSILEEQKLIQKLKNLSYEIKIHDKDLNKFQCLYPTVIFSERKIVNILNLSNELNTTTRLIIDNINRNKIQYHILEQILPVKILIDQFDQMVFPRIQTLLKNKIIQQFNQLDRSYSIIQKYSLTNIQLIHYKKSKNFTKMDQLTQQFQLYQTQQKTLSNNSNIIHSNLNSPQKNLPVLHFTNLRDHATHSKNIQQFLKEIYQSHLLIPNHHQVVIFLLGITTSKTNQFKQHPIFKAYYKYSYEQLFQIVRHLCYQGSSQPRKRIKLA